MKPVERPILELGMTCQAVHKTDSAWRKAALITVMAVTALLLIYFETALSIVRIWHRSETFAHGFLIFPISIWLIWKRRFAIKHVSPAPSFPVSILVGLAGIGWLISKAGGVLVLEQYALIVMIQATVWAILGNRAAWLIAFPLGFLFLAVPVGEFLIPPLMNQTADFVVWALQLSGIPVYREGTFFTIPSGQWSVVEGCSGLRYIIASFTLGTLYAYITYQSATRRILFALMSLLTPVLANWLRAYTIVMIAHLSGMRLALGIDHYIYGWVFFGLVMLLLFWVGSLWREEIDDHVPDAQSSALRINAQGGASKKLASIALSILIAAGIWPVYAAHLENVSGQFARASLIAPPAREPWMAIDSVPTDWRPRYLGTDAQIVQTYADDGNAVVLYVGYYGSQRQDAELINSQNQLVVQKHPVWSNVGTSELTLRLHGKPVTVRQSVLRSASQQLLVWEWYWLKGSHTSNPYISKIYLTKEKLLGRRDDGAVIIVATADRAGGDSTAMLTRYVDQMLPSIEATLRTTSSAY